MHWLVISVLVSFTTGNPVFDKRVVGKFNTEARCEIALERFKNEWHTEMFYHITCLQNGPSKWRV